MRRNEPVTQENYSLHPDALLVSRTDLLGNIVYANEAFIEASAYAYEELLNQPHNLLRHPDVPEQVFADMWQTIESGMPWQQTVKNRRKDGKHYWVDANVIPYYDNGQMTGFMSVRHPATDEQIAAAEKAYVAIAQKKAHLKNGRLEHFSLIFNPLEDINPSTAMSVMVVFFSIPALLNTFGFDVNDLWVQVSAILLPILVYLAAEFTQHRLVRLNQVLANISSGEFRNHVPTYGRNILNQLSSRINLLQTRLAVSEEEHQTILSRVERIKSAFESSPSASLVVDQFNIVVFANRAMRDFLNKRQERIRQSNPQFNPDDVLDHNVDVILPLFKQLIEKAKHHEFQVTSIRFGGRDLVVRATSIRDDVGRLLGVVLEWTDITEELAMQRSIERLVEGAQLGYLNQRLNIEGAEGFYKNFAERFNAMIDSLGAASARVNQIVMDATQGYLGKRMDGHYAGQLGGLQTALNTAFGNLGSIMVEVQSLMNKVSGIVDQLQEASSDLSTQAQQQAVALQQTNNTMQDIKTGIREVGAEIKLAQDVVSRTARNADQVTAAMQKTIEAMDGVQQNSSKIESIVGMIDGIAFQTNLLALNAAVEAARAGEHGKGFAVVAGEVRQLAQKSSEAAHIIKNLIEITSEDIRSTSELVSGTNERLLTMVDGVLGMQGYLEKVVHVSDKQSQAVLDVSKAMSMIDRTTKQTAEHSEDLAATSMVLHRTTTSLAESVSVFHVDPKQLNMTRTVALGDFAIARAIRMQRIWYAHTVNTLNSPELTSDALTVILDDEASDLAFWVKENKDDFVLLPAFQAFIEARVEMHQFAAEVVSALQRGKAVIELEKEIDRLGKMSDSVVALLVQLEAQKSENKVVAV